jgi:protein-L-isoaspartate(D-aspartate) O-methyltransferase
MRRRYGLITAALVVVGAGAALALEDEVAAREEMINILQLEVTLLSPETGIETIDPRVLDAMREVPRHLFVPEPLRDFAYGNHPLPVGHDQNIAAPLLVALMTHLIEPEPDHVVFETGTGAGYHAAVLSQLVAEVYSVEVIDELAEQAAALLAERGHDNVHVLAEDGYYGWAEHAPYDAMVIKEAVDHLPAPLLAQLKPGGRMVVPLGPADGPQYLTLVTKGENGRVREERILPVRFAPLQGGERL